MDRGLIKAFKSYHKHRKEYQDKLDVFTRYLDGVQSDQSVKLESIHQPTPEEAQMDQQVEKTLKNIQMLLRSFD